MSKQVKYCYPECEFFKCGQRALVDRGRLIYCRWVDDECEGPACKYAVCIKNRILHDKVCGLAVKRKTVEDDGPETGEQINIRLRGKLLQRLKNQEF